ncbi:MAG: universal stress protein [Haloferacaceae archaeon]
MSINPGDRPWPRALGHDDLDWPADDQRVLVPFFDAVNRSETSRLGASVAFGTDGELYVLQTVDADEPLDTDELRHEAELKLELRDQFDVPVLQAETAFERGVLDEFVDARSITTTVVDRAERRFFPRGRDGRAVANGSHTVVGTRMDRFESPSSILVPVARGPHSGLATKVAEAIARASDCWMELFHVVPADASEREGADADRLLDAYEYRLADDVEVDHHVVGAADPAEKIVEHSLYHDMTVLGAPEKGTLRRFLFGSTTDEVTRDVESVPVLTVHRNVDESALARWF